MAALGRSLAAHPPIPLEDETSLARARDAWEETPDDLRKEVRRFRRASHLHGCLVVRGLFPPLAPGVPTPMERDSGCRLTTGTAPLLLMLACGLGEPVGFRAEKQGALVHDVVPVRGLEDSQSNAGCARLLLHTENAFHEHRPDYVVLHCLRPDPEGRADFRIAHKDAAVAKLSGADLAELREPQFVTVAPPSFAGSAPPVTPHAVLSGAADDPDLRVDSTATRALTARGRAALRALLAVLDECAASVSLAAGDVVIVDNRAAAHGRTAYRPRFDGGDRWLQRVYVQVDVRRSRPCRPWDGPVLS
ncbi:TauD/TfdA family dioxygenase [Nonomuraea sp. NPDC004297]